MRISFFILHLFIITMIVSCSSKKEDIVELDENEFVYFSETNFDNTRFNVSVSHHETRALAGENYLISVQDPLTADTSSIILSLSYDSEGNIFASYYDSDYELIRIVEYDNRENILLNHPIVTRVPNGRLEGESFGDCVGRVWESYEYHVNNSGLANKIAYRLAQPVWDALFIATAAGCCHYGCS